MKSDEICKKQRGKKKKITPDRAGLMEIYNFVGNDHHEK